MKSSLSSIGCVMFLASVLASGGTQDFVPDVTYHLSVLTEPSALVCDDGQLDCTTKPPKSEKLLFCERSFYAEVWVTRSDDPGISCSYVDLLGLSQVEVISIGYGAAFGVFQDGKLGEGNVVDLGGCSLEPGGVGTASKWALVARVELFGTSEAKLRFMLTEPVNERLGTSIYGQGWAAFVDYGGVYQGKLKDPRIRSRRGPGGL